MNTEKERSAIERLKAFVPKNGEPYYLCYSGGKDSDVIRILAQLADVPHELHHNLTTVDAPETVAYLKTIPGLIIDKARYADGTPKTMWNLIPKKMMPPTRIVRWCCSELKEAGGKGLLKITGVRWAESVARAKRSGMVQIIGKPKTTQKFLEENEIDHRVNKQGGVVLNMDNADTRRAVEHCYRTTSTMVNPIIDWTDEDVWAFLHHYGCKGNPLYQCGKERVGCIGCPLAGHRKQRRDFQMYPQYKKLYIRAFDKMVEERKRTGKGCDTWKSGADVFHWWTSENPDQMQFFSNDEIDEIMLDMGITT